MLYFSNDFNHLVCLDIDCRDNNSDKAGARAGPDTASALPLWAFRLGAGRDSERRVQPRQTDAVDQFVAREVTTIKPRASRDRAFYVNESQ